MIDFERMAEEAAKSAAKSFGWSYSKEKSYSKSAGNGNGAHGVDLDELGAAIVSGADLHTAALKAIGKLTSLGYDRTLARSFLRGWFDAAHAERYAGRWPEIERAIDDIYKKEEAKERAEEYHQPPGTFIKSYADFIAEFTPLDFLLDGILIQSFLYAMTGQTGSGKTAIALQMAASIALGRPFAGRETTKRRVLYLAAENPLEVQMRCIAMAQQMDFDPADIDMFIIEGVFKISEMTDTLKAEAERIGGDFGLVVVDTGPAFFEGDDQNSRVQMLTAARTLRNLIEIIPGRPTILALMHPTKNATDNLVPAGGGTFLNEIDCNLTCAKTGDADVELHHGKMRAPEFNPINFKLNPVSHEALKSTKGKQLYTVFAEYISPTAKENREQTAAIDEKRLLRFMRDTPHASIRDLAIMMQWNLATGDPYVSKVQRAIKKLGKHVKQNLDRNWELSDEALELANGTG